MNRAAGPPFGRSLLMFLLIGAGGTAAYLAVYLTLRTTMPAQAANVTARVLVAVPTTWLSGRYAFGGRRLRWPRLVCGAVVVLSVGTAVSALLLTVEQALIVGPDVTAEVLALVAANAAAAAVRFGMLRQWLFRPPPRSDAAVEPRSDRSTTPTPTTTDFRLPDPLRRPPVVSRPAQPLRGNA